MAEFKSTPAQQQIVDCTGCTMLVSAAAGSGKTRVLIERLMKKICDPEHPCDISEFLIITYTRAAAEELRGRISEALSERLAAAPGNRRLQRQMNLLYLTQISTVHAFCASVLREHAHLLDLPPDFRVGEEQTCKMLQKRAMEDTLDAAYAQIECRQGMAELLDIIGTGRDDARLEEVILQVYTAVQSHPRPAEWIAACRSDLKLENIENAGQTKWGAYLLQELQETAALWLGHIQETVCSLQECDDTVLKSNYMPALETMLEQLKTLAEACSWDSVSALAAKNRASCKAPFNTGTAGRKKGITDIALKERIRERRERCKDVMLKSLAPFSADSSTVLSELRLSADAMQELLTLVEEFSEHYQAGKYRQRLVDYSDLEHETIRLLTTDTGSPTDIARELSARYAEIMIDEFQDSNAVQETIFEAVSQSGKNRFMVGDVKQSIYKFRLADPGIFLEKYRNYKICEQAGPGEPCRCLMSQNFRSDPQILNAVNFIFRAVMSERVGDLNYGDDEALYPPENKKTALADPAVELHVIDMDLKDTDEEGAPDRRDVEAAFAASRIKEMLKTGALVSDGNNTRPVRCGDIVILLRSPGASAGPYIRALENAGIPVFCDRGGNLFDTQEAAVLVSLLQIIDNPRRDIPLISVLLSPLAGFSYNELAEIRLLKQNGDYWDALQRAAQVPGKAQNFTALLNSLRAFAAADTVTKLLDQIWQQTDIAAIYGAMTDGAQRVRNLEAIYALSPGFDGSLMEFLDFLEGNREKGIQPPAPSAADNCVRIMSIHKSKGLEFPVVFLSDLCRQFNLTDTRSPVLVHPKYGLGAYVLDRKTMIRFPSIARHAVSSVLERESVSEELRVLYVAMTRPQSRLIMTMCRKDMERKIGKLAAETAMPVPVELAAGAESMGDWILMSALCREDAGALHTAGKPTNPVQDNSAWLIKLHRASELQKADTDSVLPGELKPAENSGKILPDLSTERLQAAMQFVYPHSSDTRIPSKLTATQLKGRTLDQETAEGAGNMLQVPDIYITRPRFQYGPMPLTAAEKGTATHLVMQFVDFTRCCTLDGVKQELDRLIEQEYITMQQAEAVHPEQITAFFASPTGLRLLSAESLVREFKFSILVPASVYYPEAAGEILLQGVVDCCILDRDGLIILDFKTDHVTDETIKARAEYYRGQMDAYAAALEKIFNCPVKERILYFFSAGKAVIV